MQWLVLSQMQIQICFRRRWWNECPVALSVARPAAETLQAWLKLMRFIKLATKRKQDPFDSIRNLPHDNICRYRRVYVYIYRYYTRIRFDREKLPPSLALTPKRPATEMLKAWQGRFGNWRRSERLLSIFKNLSCNLCISSLSKHDDIYKSICFCPCWVNTKFPSTGDYLSTLDKQLHTHEKHMLL